MINDWFQRTTLAFLDSIRWTLKVNIFFAMLQTQMHFPGAYKGMGKTA